MSRRLIFFALGLFLSSCADLNMGKLFTQVEQLNPKKITGDKNVIFIRPFASNDTPEEASKLISDKFYAALSSEEVFRKDKERKYRFDFYLGQPCPDGFECYYITGEVSAYKHEKGCCGKEGVEVTTKALFFDDLTKRPVFEVTEWNSELFETGEATEIEAQEMLADDTVKSLVKAILRELSKK